MKHRLLSTEQGLILIDEDAEIKIGDYCIGIKNHESNPPDCVFKIGKVFSIIDRDKNLIGNSDFNKWIGFSCNGQGYVYNTFSKIIAGLPELPQITNSIEEIREMVDNHLNDCYVNSCLSNCGGSSDYLSGIKDGIYIGLRLIKNSFTREQMIEAIKQSHFNDWDTIDVVQEKIFDSLQPKIDCYVDVEEVTVGELCNKHKHVPEGNFGFASDVELVKKYKIVKIL